jgi:hypothetical protein
MTAINFRIDRLILRLRGVSRDVAAAALDGLGQELGRRLARTPLSTLPTADPFRVDLGREALTDPRDAAAVREALAGRIVAGLIERRGRADRTGEGAA